MNPGLMELLVGNRCVRSFDRGHIRATLKRFCERGYSSLLICQIPDLAPDEKLDRFAAHERAPEIPALTGRSGHKPVSNSLARPAGGLVGTVQDYANYMPNRQFRQQLIGGRF